MIIFFYNISKKINISNYLIVATFKNTLLFYYTFVLNYTFNRILYLIKWLIGVKLVPNTNRKFHLIFLIIVLGVFIWSLIKPKEGYGIWILEVLPAVIGLIILVITYKRFHFSTLSYLIVVILASMTFIGGHYTYDDVPLFNWIKDHFDLKRNHYDRFGHFLKGFIVIVIREILMRKTPLNRGAWLAFISLSISLSIAALYEIIEWVYSAIRTGGKESKEFLGMQGDMWDAQWDMALTLLGSIFALLILSKLHNKYLKSFSR